MSITPTWVPAAPSSGSKAAFGSCGITVPGATARRCCGGQRRVPLSSCARRRSGGQRTPQRAPHFALPASDSGSLAVQHLVRPPDGAAVGSTLHIGRHYQLVFPPDGAAVGSAPRSGRRCPCAVLHSIISHCRMRWRDVLYQLQCHCILFAHACNRAGVPSLISFILSRAVVRPFSPCMSTARLHPCAMSHLDIIYSWRASTASSLRGLRQRLSGRTRICNSRAIAQIIISYPCIVRTVAWECATCRAFYILFTSYPCWQRLLITATRGSGGGATGAVLRQRLHRRLCGSGGGGSGHGCGSGRGGGCG